MYDENKVPIQRKSPDNHYHDTNEGTNLYVELSKLPRFSELSEKVKKVVNDSSWWDLYGKEWRDILLGVPLFILGLTLLREDSILSSFVGIFIIGCVHSIWSNRGGHQATHNALAKSKLVNTICSQFFIAFTGGFSVDIAYESHIKCHHPHTNIIGLGDSSLWKAPMFGTHVYLYVLPLMLPPIMPLFSILELIRSKRTISLPMMKFCFVHGLGLVFYTWLLHAWTGWSLTWVLIVSWMYRAILTLPYIHVNIFQHIGLTMYSQRKRPTSRLYQMATGVLNLSSNVLLNVVFGHGLISCHVEHHLFPHLSDNMCLKIKPIVKQFFLDHDLPYQEADYTERLRTFTLKYDEYMVKAPPITHFIGIQ